MGRSVTTLQNRPKTALLVLDLQNGVVAEAHERDAVVATVAGLVDRARREDVPIVLFQYSDDQVIKGSDNWQLVPELVPATSDHLIEKNYADAFDDTDLESTLADLGVGRLIVAGAQTDECIRATLHGAVVRGYDAILVSDGHTTEDHSPWGAPPPAAVIAHTNLYWTYHAAPGRTAGTVLAKDVDFGAQS